VFTAALLAHLVHLHRLSAGRSGRSWPAPCWPRPTSGWHYLVDDVAGVLIGTVSVLVAGWATRSALPRSAEQRVPELV
jgi:hypothetical protein